jgi:ABC-type multidrug transport system fused ATPase/permease subunit
VVNGSSPNNASGLEAGTEALVLDALRKLMIGRTTVIVSHRLKMVRSADLIVFLRNGAIVERDAHQELLQRDGEYARYVEIQCRPGAIAL